VGRSSRALPFLSVRDLGDWWLGVFNAAAGAIIRMVFAELTPRRAGRGIGRYRRGDGAPVLAATFAFQHFGRHM